MTYPLRHHVTERSVILPVAERRAALLHISSTVPSILHHKMPPLGVSAGLLLLLLAALQPGSGSAAVDGLVNEEVKRTVDLSSHLAKVSVEVLLANPGPGAVHSFTLAVEPEQAPHLAYVGASVSPAGDE